MIECATLSTFCNTLVLFFIYFNFLFLNFEYEWLILWKINLTIERK